MVSTIPVPGTVQLIDAEGTLNVKHGRHKEIVLVPQPTNDPDDPLRWSHPRKILNVTTAMAWCFLIAGLISGLSPAYLLIEEETGISVSDLSTGNGIMYLFLGWGTMITQCVALNWGRRNVLVVSGVLSGAVSLWTAYVQSRGEFFVNRIILGIVASPQETLIEVIIGDIFFTHDRGFYMGAYSWALWCGAFLAPVASGYVAQDLGWQWIQYIMAIVGLTASLLTFFFFEETMFFRDHTMLSDESITLAAAHTEKSPAADSVKSGNLEKNDKVDSTNNFDSSTSRSINELTPVPVGTNKTYTQKLKLWDYRDERQPSAFRVFFLPLRLIFMFPGMFFGGLLVGGILATYNVVGGSLALILGNAPYNFSASSLGLTYLACVVGVTVGCFVSGWMADILAVMLARRNGGIMEPEQRLWISLIPLILHPAGCLLYGVGASYHIHWAGVVVGLGLISVTLPIGSNLAFTYVLDSYKEVAGEGFVSVILIRNMMGMSLFLNTKGH